MKTHLHDCPGGQLALAKVPNEKICGVFTGSAAVSCAWSARRDSWVPGFTSRPAGAQARWPAGTSEAEMRGACCSAIRAAITP